MRANSLLSRRSASFRKVASTDQYSRSRDASAQMSSSATGTCTNPAAALALSSLRNGGLVSNSAGHLNLDDGSNIKVAQRNLRNRRRTR